MHEYNVFDILVDHFHPYCLMTVIAVWLALACRNGDRKIKIIGRQMAPRDSRSGWKGRMSMSDHTGQRAIESEGTETGGTPGAPGTPTEQAGPPAGGRYRRRALNLGAAAVWLRPRQTPRRFSSARPTRPAAPPRSAPARVPAFKAARGGTAWPAS